MNDCFKIALNVYFNDYFKPKVCFIRELDFWFKPTISAIKIYIFDPLLKLLYKMFLLAMWFIFYFLFSKFVWSCIL